MFLCTMVPYKYMTLHKNDVLNLADNTHVQIKYHFIIYIVNDVMLELKLKFLLHYN